MPNIPPCLKCGYHYVSWEEVNAKLHRGQPIHIAHAKTTTNPYLIQIRCHGCGGVLQNRPLLAGNMPVEGNQLCEDCLGKRRRITPSERMIIEGPAELIDIEKLSHLLNPKPKLEPKVASKPHDFVTTAMWQTRCEYCGLLKGDSVHENPKGSTTITGLTTSAECAAIQPKITATIQNNPIIVTHAYKKVHPLTLIGLFGLALMIGILASLP